MLIERIHGFLVLAANERALALRDIDPAHPDAGPVALMRAVTLKPARLIGDA